MGNVGNNELFEYRQQEVIELPPPPPPKKKMFTVFLNRNLRRQNVARRSYRGSFRPLRVKEKGACAAEAEERQTVITERNLSKDVLTFRHRASCILGQAFYYSPENDFYIFNQKYISLSDICLTVHH